MTPRGKDQSETVSVSAPDPDAPNPGDSPGNDAPSQRPEESRVVPTPTATDPSTLTEPSDEEVAAVEGSGDVTELSDEEVEEVDPPRYLVDPTCPPPNSTTIRRNPEWYPPAIVEAFTDTDDEVAPPDIPAAFRQQAELDAVSEGRTDRGYVTSEGEQE